MTYAVVRTAVEQFGYNRFVTKTIEARGRLNRQYRLGGVFLGPLRRPAHRTVDALRRALGNVPL